MATTVTPATFTSTITESVTLNGVDQGGTHTFTLASVTETDRRIVNIGTSVTDVIGFAAANGQGAFVRTDVKYMRFTNLDDTNYIILGFSKTGADTVYLKLEAGKTIMFGNDELMIHATGGAFSAFVEADNVDALANGAACDLEYMVCGT